MKKTLIITFLVVLFLSIGSVGYHQYVKANEKFTDYEKKRGDSIKP